LSTYALDRSRVGFYRCFTSTGPPQPVGNVESAGERRRQAQPLQQQRTRTAREAADSGGV